MPGGQVEGEREKALESMKTNRTDIRTACYSTNLKNKTEATARYGASPHVLSIAIVTLFYTYRMLLARSRQSRRSEAFILMNFGSHLVVRTQHRLVVAENALMGSGGGCASIMGAVTGALN